MAKAISKQPKKEKKDEEMKKDQSIYHEIGKGEEKKEEETDPYYMEEIDKIR